MEQRFNHGMIIDFPYFISMILQTQPPLETSLHLLTTYKSIF